MFDIKLKAIWNIRTYNLLEIAERINKKYYPEAFIKSIKFRKQNSKWGSYTKNRINISHRLLFAREKLIEYVVAHEISHFYHMNHSRDFWSMVERAIPDYKRMRMLLRKYELNLDIEGLLSD